MQHTYQKFIKNILTPTQIITFGKITSEHFHRHNQEQWPSKAAILLETKRSKMDVNWKWTESLAWHFSEIIVECKEKVEAMPSRWRLRTHEFHIKTNIHSKDFSIWNKTNYHYFTYSPCYQLLFSWWMLIWELWWSLSWSWKQ